MDLSNRPREGGTLPDQSNASSEHTPLLAKAPSSITPEADATAVYVKIINDHLPWYKRPSVLWLIPMYGVSAISTGMLTSSLGLFQAAMLCREYMNRHSSNTTLAGVTYLAEQVSSTSVATSGLASMMVVMVPDDMCKTPEVLAFVAKTMALIEVIGGIASMFAIGYYASLSDKHGRLKIMILGFVATLTLLLSIIAMGIWWDEFGLPLMILSSLVVGLMGGIGTGSTMCLAYAADCTDPAKRSLVYSYLHAGLYLGLGIGPILGGYLTDKTGTILTIVYIDIVTSILSILLAIFVVPESIPSKQPLFIRELFERACPPKKDTPSSDAHAPWHSHAVRAFSFFKPNGRNTNLILLAIISFLQMLAVRGTLSVIVLYTLQTFQWREFEVGVLFTLGHSVRLFTLLVLLPILVHWYQKASKRKQLKARAKAEREAKKHGKQLDNNGNDNDINDTFKRYDSSNTLYDPNLPQSGTHSRVPTKDTLDPSITFYTEDHVINNSQLIVNPNDLNVAASVQQLGEAALEYAAESDDEDEGETSSLHRHHQSSQDNISSSSSHIPNTHNNTEENNKHPSGAAIRTKEQTFSDMKFDTWMIRLGFAINSITYVGYGLATEGWMFYLASALHAVCIISSPSLKSLLTNLVEPSQFGAVLGAIQVVDSVAAIFSPIVISWVYALTVKSWPEFVWYSCAAWTGICVVLSFMIRQKQFRSNIDNA
ncbi:hypothetical protein BGZ74_007412 [Mortierella antarctica]|nr:hypothetical protein BGZ74_007412 [Mortierella antarctica]